VFETPKEFDALNCANRTTLESGDQQQMVLSSKSVLVINPKIQ